MLGVKVEQVNAKRGHAAGHSRAHFSYAYSSLASFTMEMSGSASFRWGEKTKGRLR